jgi:hypothetical protein
MGSSGGSGTQATTNNIAPEVKPLFAQTGSAIQSLQPYAFDMMPDLFGQNVQQIPGFTSGQEQTNAFLQQQAFGNPLNQQQQQTQAQLNQAYNNPYSREQANASDYANWMFKNPATAQEQDAYRSLTQLTNSPIGSSPATQAAMQSLRAPVLNDLALSGMGNSDAVGTALSSAYAPIVAQEMQQRFAAIPMLSQMGSNIAGRQMGNTAMLNDIGNAVSGRQMQTTGMLGQLGQTGYAQQQGNLGAYGQSEAERRGIGEAQGQAVQQDLLRRQGLAQQWTTGILRLGH